MHDQLQPALLPSHSYDTSPINTTATVVPLPSYQYLTGQPTDLFARIVQTHHQETHIPLSLCIQAALSIGAFVQQGIRELEAPSGHITPASLMTAGVFPPALGKSTLIERFTAPIDAFMQTHEQTRQQQHKEHVHQQKLWEKTYKNLTDKLGKVNAYALEKQVTGEETKYQKALNLAKILEIALERHRHSEPQPLLPTGLKILGDVTPAGLSQAISQEHIQSLAIISSEAEEFLTKGIQQHSAILNKGFSGEQTQRHLATRGDESHHIPITALLFGQPTVMEQAFGGDNNRLRGTGTIARLLFTSPSGLSAPHGSAQPAPDAAQAKEDYYYWVDQMLQDNEAHFAAAEPRKRLQLSEEARQLWHQGRQEIHQQIAPNGRYARFEDHARRLPEQWLRVALVLHGYNEPQKPTVSAQTLQLAIQLVNAFSTEFVTIFYQPTQAERDVQQVLQWCDEKRSQGARYATQRYIRKMLDLKPVARIETALNTLACHGQVQCFPFQPTNHKGIRLKPVLMVDLYPRYVVDEARMNYVVQLE